MPIAVLDFDKTITCTDTTKIWLLAYLICSPLSAIKAILTVLVSFNSLDKSAVKEKILKSAYQGCSEPKISRVDRLFRVLLKTFRVRRESVLGHVRDYIENGFQVLIVTASAQNSVLEAMSDFSVDVIGTKFSISEGRFTGEVESPFCFGDEKVIRFMQFIEANCLDLSELEVAWGDSASDFALMRLAGTRIWIGKRDELAKLKVIDSSGKFIIVDC